MFCMGCLCCSRLVVCSVCPQNCLVWSMVLLVSNVYILSVVYDYHESPFHFFGGDAPDTPQLYVFVSLREIHWKMWPKS